MEEGILIIFEPKASQISRQRIKGLGLKSELRYFNGRTVQALRIPDMKAVLLYDGGIGVQKPGSDETHRLFFAKEYFEVRELEGDRLVRRNPLLCTRCSTNTLKKVQKDGIEVYRCRTCSLERPVKRSSKRRGKRKRKKVS